jgi:hypothetical protein
MRYSALHQSITANFKSTNRIVPYVTGKPGGGKSALGRQIAREMGVKEEHYTEFNASLRDPVDVLGVPDTHGEYTAWKPPIEFFRLRATNVRGDDAPRFLNLEEFSDATVPMQNALCRVIEDRYAGELRLHHNLYIYANGNRTEDKSGAQRMTTKLMMRVQELEFETNLDDWCEWALDAGIQVPIIQFLRFKPNQLHDFVADRRQNPCPRQWEKVSLIDVSLPSELYMGNVAGLVGEGAAAEYTGFLRIFRGLPDIDGILMHPDKGEVPKDPAVLYALTGALAHRASEDNFDRLARYSNRLPVDFQVMLVSDAAKLAPKVKQTKAFVDWAVKNSNVLV